MKPITYSLILFSLSPFFFVYLICNMPISLFTLLCFLFFLSPSCPLLHFALFVFPHLSFLTLPDPSVAVEPAAKEAEVPRRFSLTSSLASSSSSSFATRRTKGTWSAVWGLHASTFWSFNIFLPLHCLLLLCSHSLLLNSHTRRKLRNVHIYRVVQLCRDKLMGKVVELRPSFR